MITHTRIIECIKSRTARTRIIGCIKSRTARTRIIECIKSRTARTHYSNNQTLISFTIILGHNVTDKTIIHVI